MMMRKIVLNSVSLALATAILSPLALAGNASVTGNVTKVLVTSDAALGGCMAMLSVNPRSKLSTCHNSWVSFGCSQTDPVRAYRMLDQAQLALATGNTVSVFFTDTTLYNGYCSVTRIDVGE